MSCTGTFVPAYECRVPPGATVVELRYCQNCGKPFARPRLPMRPYLVEVDGYDITVFVEQGVKFCGVCVGSQLALPDQEEYRDMLPKEAEMRHRTGLTYYPKEKESVNRGLYK